MSDKEAASKEQARQFGELLNFQIEAATSEDAMTKGARLTLALICVLGAFGVAGWLVVEGPPATNTPTAAQGVAPSKEAKVPQSGAEQPPSERPGATTVPTTTATDTTEGSGLSEEAPWVFAIVALAVAAFLAAGQSIGFGGASTAKNEAKDDDDGPDKDDTGKDDTGKDDDGGGENSVKKGGDEGGGGDR